MRFIDNRLIQFLAIVALLGLWVVAGCATPPPPAATVSPVKILPMIGPLNDPRAEVSGLTWKGDTLVVMPQEPQIFGQNDRLGFFVIPKEKILAAIAAPESGPIKPRQVECEAPGMARIIRGFDGLEAIGIRGNRCYMTVEAKEDTTMAGYLISGLYDAGTDRVRMDMTRLAAIPMGLNIPNIAEESLIIDGDRIITLSEANGSRCNPQPRAKVFDKLTNYLGSIPFPNIEYRVTDATALDEQGRFWVMNYFFPPEREKLQVASDPEVANFGLPPGLDPTLGVERLLELRLDGDTIVRTDTPPIYFEPAPDGGCRNWEAVVRLDDRGFLVMTDQYPGTLLAFVPYPYRQLWNRSGE
jgi:hypothetical protein